jgi:hypothetical protein
MSSPLPKPPMAARNRKPDIPPTRASTGVGVIASGANVGLRGRLPHRPRPRHFAG